MLCHEFFKQDPFMRGMLVYEIQSIGTFRNQISRADLTDQAEQRNCRLDPLCRGWRFRWRNRELRIRGGKLVFGVGKLNLSKNLSLVPNFPIHPLVSGLLGGQ